MLFSIIKFSVGIYKHDMLYEESFYEIAQNRLCLG